MSNTNNNEETEHIIERLRGLINASQIVTSSLDSRQVMKSIIELARDMLQAEVDMVSNVGPDKYLHARIGATPVTVRAPKDYTVRPETSVPLFLDPSRLHIFVEGRRMG